MSTCSTLQDGIESIANDPRDEVFIAGGEQVYRLFLPYADTVYLTEIDFEPAGDTTFPDLPADLHCVEKVDVIGPTRYPFFTYCRTVDQGLGQR